MVSQDLALKSLTNEMIKRTRKTIPTIKKINCRTNTASEMIKGMPVTSLVLGNAITVKRNPIIDNAK